jgi:plastocyanin
MRRMVVVAAAVLLAAACGGDGEDPTVDTGTEPPVDATETGGGDTSGDGDASGEATLTIADFTFGGDLTVPAGATVTVVNEDSVTHTVTADDGSFDSGGVSGEGSFTAPTDAGTYPFHCNIHPNMTADLTVEG